MKPKIGLIVTIMSILIIITIRFVNINMSETKLFFKYFYVWVGLIIAMIVGGVFYGSDK